MSNQRLIDANELKAYARTRITYYLGDCETEAANHWRDFIDAIDNATTVPAVALPCKVGDTVWTNLRCAGSYLREKDKPYKVQVVFVGLNATESGGFINVAFYGGWQYQFDFSQIGKSAFLTREEAEAALRRAEG